MAARIPPTPPPMTRTLSAADGGAGSAVELDPGRCKPRLREALAAKPPKPVGIVPFYPRWLRPAHPVQEITSEAGESWVWSGLLTMSFRGRPKADRGISVILRR